MSSLSEKQDFSERLRNALEKAGYPASPTVIAKEFNLRYDGTPVSVQSANNWLQGKAIPNQDKLSVLSLWLGVSSQWLRFGDEDENIPKPTYLDQEEDLEYFLKFQRLTTSQKNIIQQLIDEFQNQ